MKVCDDWSIACPSWWMCGLLILGLLTSPACQSLQTALSKQELEVNTKMSETIFLEPVSPEKRTIYINVRNTSDKDNFDIEAPIITSIAKHGYRVIDNPDVAHYWLQANVLMVKKGSPDDAKEALGEGYGGALVGGALGAGVGAATHGKTGAIAGGLIGGALGAIGESVSSALVTDVMYVAVTDIQVVERAAKGVAIRSQSRQRFRRGQNGTQQMQYQEVGSRKKFRTRVVSTANKANLQYHEAETLLARGLTRAVANLF